jgi:hypothetical protein
MIDVPNPAINAEPWVKNFTTQKGLEQPLNFLMGILCVCGMLFSIIYNSNGLSYLPYQIIRAPIRQFNPRHEDAVGRLEHIQDEIKRLRDLPKLTNNQKKLLEKLNEDETVFTHRVKMDEALKEVEIIRRSDFVCVFLKNALVSFINNPFSLE